ncbi:hypothetical protein GCM10007387_37050 [Pseudoduganella albidiflava]|uniref:Uncharacterized protein n=1 Tax=Pseudoduganella albidiflava TaxID=321983 RepID=A0AA87XWK9_9BURK|nr:hypothetical protein GCM10007387_37050 [Pseudoduganella albidiflava]
MVTELQAGPARVDADKASRDARHGPFRTRSGRDFNNNGNNKDNNRGGTT